jgi:PEP-CTERM motif
VVTLGKSVLLIDGGGVPPPTPGAPEPATWAMMMLGFVGLGAVADRKRAAFKAA